MKKFIYLMSVALMAMMSFTLTSCGGDDDDNVLNTTTTENLKAVHKIKVTVSGQTNLFKWSAHFRGMVWNGNQAEVAKIYDEKGNVIEYLENFSQVTAQTDKNGTLMAAALLITDFDENNTGEMTIQLEGWIDGKMTNSKTIKIKAGEQKAHTVSFSTVPLND